ncbi:hypothetical protein [Halomonas sp. BM-2019]|uniref:hypothetical protein n=1 Tax=Halomonas sp. BM-2019 TaxID=2811227 RepID=UPI001B3C3C54|nr:MAG: hypothetical protein J5F18_13705 [Halomonas sp. BM-2019]
MLASWFITMWGSNTATGLSAWIGESVSGLSRFPPVQILAFAIGDLPIKNMPRRHLAEPFVTTIHAAGTATTTEIVRHCCAGTQRDFLQVVKKNEKSSLL